MAGLTGERSWSLPSQLAKHKAGAATARAEVQRKQQELEEQACALMAARAQAEERAAALAEAAAERRLLEAARDEAVTQAEALQKGLSVAEGKLVLARQREAHFKASCVGQGPLGMVLLALFLQYRCL